MHASLTSILTFSLAIGLATASPGPTIAALLARALGRGSRGMPAFCAGLVLGDMIWLAAAVFGLAVIAQTAQPVFVVAKYAGAAYLLWLAYKMWTAPGEFDETHSAPRGEGLRLFAAGVALALGNPKTMVFYVALAPALIDLTQLSTAEFALLEGLLVVIYGTVLSVYLLAAARARSLVKESRVVRRVNRASGTVMAGAALLVATR
jgi:threonine/homoserine/homoserine lactone efflux protein